MNFKFAARNRTEVTSRHSKGRRMLEAQSRPSQCKRPPEQRPALGAKVECDHRRLFREDCEVFRCHSALSLQEPWAWHSSPVDLAPGCGSWGAPATCGGSHLLYFWPCATAQRYARPRFCQGGAQVEANQPLREILDATSCGRFKPEDRRRPAPYLTFWPNMPINGRSSPRRGRRQPPWPPHPHIAPSPARPKGAACRKVETEGGMPRRPPHKIWAADAESLA